MPLTLFPLVRRVLPHPAATLSARIFSRAFRGRVVRWLAPLALLGLPAASSAQSAFQGTWKGAWRDQGSGQDGLMVLNIARGGAVSGAVSNRQSGLTGPVKARINASGFLAGSYGYREGSVIRVYQTTCAFSRSGDQLAGTARFLFQGRLIGTAGVALERDPASAPARPPPKETPRPPSPAKPAPEEGGKSDLKN